MKEAIKPLDDTATATKKLTCAGQLPQDTTKLAFNSWPQDAKDYATNNVAQWLAAGCTL